MVSERHHASQIRGYHVALAGGAVDGCVRSRRVGFPSTPRGESYDIITMVTTLVYRMH